MKNIKDKYLIVGRKYNFINNKLPPTNYKVARRRSCRSTRVKTFN